MTSGASAAGEPVGVFWDLENCGLPAAHCRSHLPAAAVGGTRCGGTTVGPVVVPEQVASNVRDFARRYGRVVSFHAYSDPHGSGLAPDKRLALQQSGVRLIDIPNHRKEAADKAIIVDICMFAVEYKVPATIILISGDRDFANALQRLYQHGYTIVVVSMHNSGAVPNPLKYVSKGNIVRDWQALALHGCPALDLPGSPPRQQGIASGDHPEPPPLAIAQPSVVSAAATQPMQPSAPASSDPVQSSRFSTPPDADASAPAPASTPVKATGFRYPLPWQCAAAIKEFWKSRPDHTPVQHPYAALLTFLKQHPKCGGYKRWGYTKLTHFLMDAQRNGLVWLRPGTVQDAMKGQPFAEIAPVVNKREFYSPLYVLYWLALGFSQEEADRHVQQVQRKAWADDVVGKLASNSPHFDKELHASWYFDKAGMSSFAVRSAKQAMAGGQGGAKGQAAPKPPAPQKGKASEKRPNHEAVGADSSSGYIDGAKIVTLLRSLSLPRFPPECAEAISDFWETTQQPVQHPYASLVSFLKQHPQCGGHKKWGYGTFTKFLKDAQAAGLVWLRPGAVLDTSLGEPFLEIAPAAKTDLDNPGHILYWLALDFSQGEAVKCVQLAREEAWADEVVGKLASNSPRYDPELHARWYFDRAGMNSFAVRSARKSAQKVMDAGPDSVGARAVTFLRTLSRPAFPPECAEAIADFWKSFPDKHVQNPYTDFVSFLARHPKCGGYTSWGYITLNNFLRDAQAAGLVWLRPPAGLDAVKAQPFPEIAPASSNAHCNPNHVLYWLALGFAQEEAAAYVRLVQREAWSIDEVVKTLASTSPHFDKELHARWYFDSVGCGSWAVRAMEWHHAKAATSSAPDNQSVITPPASTDGSASGSGRASVLPGCERGGELGLDSKNLAPDDSSRPHITPPYSDRSWSGRTDCDPLSGARPMSQSPVVVGAGEQSATPPATSPASAPPHCQHAGVSTPPSNDNATKSSGKKRCTIC